MKVSLEKYSYFLVVDLEATCCDKQTVKLHEMEIIEIGAVIADQKALNIIDEFQTFVRPVRNPVLTDFCKKLTSITQADVDTAPTYPEAIGTFKKWLNQYSGFIFCSWGDYDKGQFEQDCRFHRLPYPFDVKHLNIKKLFSERNGLKRKFAMAEALEIAGLTLNGTYHRGIDDARNIARLIPFAMGRDKLKFDNLPKRKRR